MTNKSLNSKPSRFDELDIAKGSLILFIAFVHTVYEILNPDLVADSTPLMIFVFAAAVLGAPVFMMLLGTSLELSRYKDNWHHFVKRGFQLFLAAYVLNFLRGPLTLLLHFQLYGYTDWDEFWYECFNIDIFHLAGMFMMFWGGLVRVQLHRKPWVLLLLGTLFSVVNFTLLPLQVENNYLLMSITGLFWASSDWSYFPFFGCAFYPIIGVLFSRIYVKVADKNVFYRRMFVLGCISIAAILGGYFAFDLLDLLTREFYSYHQSLYAQVVSAAGFMIFLAMCYCASKYISESAMKHFRRWSKHISLIYVLHWIYISLITIFVPPAGLDLYWFFIIPLPVFLLSDWTASWFFKKFHRTL